MKRKEKKLNSNKLRVLEMTACDIVTYLVFKNGIIIPAAVATSNKTTCNTVNTTFISLTISARAFELSIPSTVTYCCCDKCSIFEIYNNEEKKNVNQKFGILCARRCNFFSIQNFVFYSLNMALLWFDSFPRLHSHHVIFHHSGTVLFLPYLPVLALNFRFHSRERKNNDRKSVRYIYNIVFMTSKKCLNVRLKRKKSLIDIEINLNYFCTKIFQFV